MANYLIKTARLGLRNWTENDLVPFAEMCADAEVMRYFPKPLTTSEVAALIERFQKHFDEFGYTYFAVDELATGKFIGFTGLMYQTYEAPFTPNADIGWRLKQNAWGKGFASEAATACLDFGFKTIKLSAIYAVCPKQNQPSEGVMKKIGMHYDTKFIHPALDDYPALAECLLYKIEP